VLDDRLVADVYQTVFDVFWKEATSTISCARTC
jgi:hypothetical protein